MDHSEVKKQHFSHMFFYAFVKAKELLKQTETFVTYKEKVSQASLQYGNGL